LLYGGSVINENGYRKIPAQNVKLVIPPADLTRYFTTKSGGGNQRCRGEKGHGVDGQPPNWREYPEQEH
jgi:hypothetical protein